MRVKTLLASVLLCLFSVRPVALAGDKAEFGWTFVDPGACPFECCQYGTWTTTEPVLLRAEPNESAEVLVRIDAGIAVQAVTGEVHTLPGRFKIKKDSPPYRVGDEVLILTYLGEGSFKIQFKGQINEDGFDFGPDNGYSEEECLASPSCIGVLEASPESRWWALIRHSDMQGWTLVEGNFSGTDACE